MPDTPAVPPSCPARSRPATRRLTLVAGITAAALAAGVAAAAASDSTRTPQSKPATAPGYSPHNLGAYTIISGPAATIPANGGYINATASCPAGQVALGGGEGNSSWGKVLLTDSRPNGSSSWLVWVRNDAPTTATVTPYVVCGR